jgi:predicted HNH restriction endonuclease
MPPWPVYGVTPELAAFPLPMSFTPATTLTHDALLRALAGMQGQILSPAEIRQSVHARVPEIGNRIQWLFPSDHCDNHVVKGSCQCAGADAAPLTRVGQGRYLVRSLQMEPEKSTEKNRVVITAADFLQTVEANAHEVLTTVGGKAAFTTVRHGNDVRFVPVSSGDVHNLNASGLQRYLDIFNQTNSFITTGYKDGMRHASYVLAVIRLWLGQRQALDSAESGNDNGFDEDFSDDETRLQARSHQRRERSRELVRMAKAVFQSKNDGRLFCEVCYFDFGPVYGEPDFIEVHHRVPLRDLKPGTLTKISDLAMVCANCHRMLHRGPQWLTIHSSKPRWRGWGRRNCRKRHERRCTLTASEARFSGCFPSPPSRRTPTPSR